jgi:hypothetical protein
MRNQHTLNAWEAAEKEENSLACGSARQSEASRQTPEGVRDLKTLNKKLASLSIRKLHAQTQRRRTQRKFGKPTRIVGKDLPPLQN